MATHTRAIDDDAGERLHRAERRAVQRWHPGQRWYHPVLARSVIATSRFVMRVMNRLDIEGFDHLDAVRDRGGRGLLTFSNHVSLFDDPLLTSNFVRMPYQRVRWVGADALNFFGTPFKSWLFTAGKAAPIVRGGGIEQPGMHLLRERLLAGDWVHMFPEGGRTRDPEARMTRDFKSGIGWLLAETHPIALPFYHYGMHEILPVGATRPRSGHRVRVVFGKPFDCDESWLREASLQHADRAAIGPALWEALTIETRDILSAMEQRIHPAAATSVGQGPSPDPDGAP